MKKSVFLIVIAMMMAFTSFAQKVDTVYVVKKAPVQSYPKVEFTPFAGYTFADRFDLGGGEAKIEDGMSWGAGLTIVTSRVSAIEIAYTRMETEMWAHNYYNYGDSWEDEVAMNYILIGGQRLIPASEKVNLFAGGNIGVGFVNSKNDKFSTITKFAAGFDAGLKYFISDKVGIRLQADLKFPVTNVGASFGWSTGGGAGAGVSGYIPFVQFSFLGGLVINLR